MSNDRIAAFLNAAGGDALELSEGSVYHFCKKLSRNSAESIAHLEETVVYHAMDSRSIDALKRTGFLSGYSGILVHDHETALYHFGTDHAECNVHIIWYLRKNTSH